MCFFGATENNTNDDLKLKKYFSQMYIGEKMINCNSINDLESNSFKYTLAYFKYCVINIPILFYSFNLLYRVTDFISCKVLSKQIKGFMFL